MVFPLPEGPTTATNPCGSTLRLMFLSTVNGRPPLEYVWVRSRAMMIMTRKILLPAFFTALTLACGADEPPREQGTPTVAAQGEAARPVVLFFGTSLTAGLGVEPSAAFPAIIRQKLDSAGLAYHVVNAGENGATSAGGVRRIDWFLRLPIAVLVLELGANDGLRGQDVSALRENLQKIIDRTEDVSEPAKLRLRQAKDRGTNRTVSLSK